MRAPFSRFFRQGLKFKKKYYSLLRKTTILYANKLTKIQQHMKNRDGRFRSCFIGGFDHPIIVPITYLLVLLAAYCLPFAIIYYSMHTISPGDILRSPVPIHTTRIRLNVMLYGVCGRQNGEALRQISQNMETLRNAGNRPQAPGSDDAVYDNRLQLILDTKLTRVNAYLCGDGGVVHADRQYSTWVAAGLAVTLILMMAGALSLLCIAIICALDIARRRHDDDRRGAGRCVWLLSDAISWLVIFASLLYVSLTYQERGRSHASFGSGCVFMSIASVLIGARLARFSPARCMSTLGGFKCSREKNDVV